MMFPGASLIVYTDKKGGKKKIKRLVNQIYDFVVRVKTESVPQNHGRTSKVYGTSNLQITI